MANEAGLQAAPAATRSIFTRWVRGAIVLTLLALGALLAVVLLQSWHSSSNALANAVDTDMAGLVDIYASGGLEELQSRLADRTALTAIDGRQAHYLLGNAGGARLAGDLEEWPELAPSLSQAGFVTMADGTRLYARATRLGPDLDLLVAREYGPDRAAIERLAVIFVASGALIVLAVWLIGRRAAARLRRRLAAIIDAFRAAEKGQAPATLGAQPRDEIGELARHSSNAIARVANLARTHRHMSDHIAHEIRTPLTHLDNRLVECLRLAGNESERAQFDKCRQDIRSVVTMLDSLLDIAASEARVGDRTGLEPVDLSALADDLVELYSGSAEEAGLSLKSRIEPGVTMPGERMQLTRLISNLLDNALKYVPRGGTVELNLAAGPVLDVRDDGPGVAEHLRPFVFERFRSGQHAENRSSHGLGLALARAIALRHDLRIELVDSGKGAHFVVKPHALWSRAQ